jgi:hypothetical protein
MRRFTDRAISQRVPDQRTRPPASSRDLEFRMSNETCLREAMRAVAHVGENTFAVPVERGPSQPLLLVLHADDEDVTAAIDAVLSIDAQAEASGLSRVPFADNFEDAWSEHTSEIVELEPLGGWTRTRLWATCKSCSWRGPVRESSERADQDARLHRLERAVDAHGSTRHH